MLATQTEQRLAGSPRRLTILCRTLSLRWFLYCCLRLLCHFLAERHKKRACRPSLLMLLVLEMNMQLFGTAIVTGGCVCSQSEVEFGKK